MLELFFKCKEDDLSHVGTVSPSGINDPDVEVIRQNKKMAIHRTLELFVM
jgi:hypothetical protein